MTKRRTLYLSGFVITGLLLAAIWIRCGPLPAGLLTAFADESPIVVDRHGRVLYESRSGSGTRRIDLSEAALSPWLVSATLAAEDRRFYRHPGIDLLAIARAAMHDVEAGGFVEGGSTISQQVAKLLLAQTAASRTGRGLAAKFRESITALRLEHRLTKREILTLYLNLAPYGNQLQGAERASHAYFGCSSNLLTPAQAAFIAGLPQQPSRLNPYRSMRLALVRQRHVIDQMVESGAMSRALADEARAEHLTLKSDEAVFAAPHFVEMVLAERDSKNRSRRIDTTLDLELQREVQGIIRSQRPNLESHGAHNVAVVVLRNDTAEWLAWEGSGDYFDGDHGGTINGALALRQPGSALKPFTYALAFEEGSTPATVLADVPTHFPTAEDGILYSPRNYDGQYRGPLLARRALAGSENVPAVALASSIGVPTLVRFLRSAGLSTFDKNAAFYGLGLTLGNAEVRLAELVGAYAAFARGGLLLAPADRLREHRELARLTSPRTAFWITDILSDSAAREYVFGRGGSLEFPFAVAAKTGTSEGYHDNWAIGYTRELTVGVWVGNFDRSPLTNSSGVTGAGPIFHAVMVAAQRYLSSRAFDDRALADVPENVARVTICALSGMRANANCPARINEWLPIDDHGPACTWHHDSESGVVVVWPSTYSQWAKEHGLSAASTGQQTARDAEARAASHRSSVKLPDARVDVFEIANPPTGAIYLIDPTLRPEFQTLSLRASAESSAEIEWAVDGKSVGRARADESLRWPLAAGEHHIVARDDGGRVARTTVIVK